jgi:hypothetical protein
MTALTVEVSEVHPPVAGLYPWPTVVGMVVGDPDGRRCGDLVRVAAEPYAAEAIAADLAELGAMPPVVVVEPWQVVAVVAYAEDYRTCDGCGTVEDAGTAPDLDGQGFGPCCTAVTA